jgi:hypothetical protein
VTSNQIQPIKQQIAHLFNLPIFIKVDVHALRVDFRRVIDLTLRYIKSVFLSVFEREHIKLEVQNKHAMEWNEICVFYTSASTDSGERKLKTNFALRTQGKKQRARVMPIIALESTI